MMSQSCDLREEIFLSNLVFPEMDVHNEAITKYATTVTMGTQR